MHNLRLRLAMLGGLALTITFGYGNCSPVHFANDTQASLQRLNAQGGILINNGAEYTNKEDVGLTLVNNSADEMYITNDPKCASGGAWEKFALNKPWSLSGKNSDVKVFAKFREKETEVESSCFEDDIVHDDIAPILTLTSSVKNFINMPQAMIDFTVLEAGSGIDTQECLLDTKDRMPCANSHNRMGLAEGPHSLQVLATDKAGNVAIPVQSAFVVDLTKPTLVLNQTPAKVSNQIKSDFQFTGNDALSGIEKTQCRESAVAAWKDCVSPFSFSAIEGKQISYFRAVDKAGNISDEVNYDWTIDLTAPTVTITKGPGPFSNTAVANFEFAGTDNGLPLVKYECSVDNAAVFAACTSPFASLALAEGNHIFYVRGYDGAGNVSAPATYMWLIDMTAPSVQILTGPNAVTTNKDATFTFSGADGNGSGIDHYECQLNNGGYVKCTSPDLRAALADNAYTYQVIAFDRAGNKSPAASRDFRVDTIKPEVEITKMPLAQTKDVPSIFDFIAKDAGSGVAEIDCSIDSATGFVPCVSPKAYTDLLDGVHTFYVKAIDKAGLESDVKTYSWLLDRLGPAINIGQQPNATVAAGSASNIQFIVTDAGVGVNLVSCMLDGANRVCSANFMETLNLPIGLHSYSIHAEDKLGNVSDKTINWAVVQTTMPVSQDVTVTANNKADVLVVIDNSGSMATEQANMASRFGAFLDVLKNLDWQVGIVTTDVSNDAAKKDGRFLEINGLPGQYLFTSQMDPAVAKTNFGATIQRPQSEGSGNEQGIRASYRTIERAFDATNPAASAPNRAFFRAGAALSVLVVTDADETNPAGTLASNTPAGLVALVQSKFGTSKPFAFHSIIVKPGDEPCLKLAGSGNEGYGNAYAALSGLTGGIIGTVCAPDYAAQLAAMGKAVVDSVKSVTLTCAPLDTNNDGKADVVVTTADGSAAPAYTINGLSLVFDKALPLGKNKLDYTCLK